MLSTVDGTAVTVDGDFLVQRVEDEIIGPERPVTLLLQTKENHFAWLDGGGEERPQSTARESELADDDETVAAESGEFPDAIDYCEAVADYHAGEEQDLYFDEGGTIGVTSKEDDAWWKGFVYARNPKP